MIFITGPLFSGKMDYARKICDENRIIRDVQELAAECDNMSKLADKLMSEYKVIIATEIGGGVVPIDPKERDAREKAGRLSCLLAERADAVVRVFCGIPMVIKGELPC